MQPQAAQAKYESFIWHNTYTLVRTLAVSIVYLYENPGDRFKEIFIRTCLLDYSKKSRPRTNAGERRIFTHKRHPRINAALLLLSQPIKRQTLELKTLFYIIFTNELP